MPGDGQQQLRQHDDSELRLLARGGRVYASDVQADGSRPQLEGQWHQHCGVLRLVGRRLQRRVGLRRLVLYARLLCLLSRLVVSYT